MSVKDNKHDDNKSSLRQPSVLFVVAATVVLFACHANVKDIGQCPQPRFTEQAPQDYYTRVNPLAATGPNIDAGRNLFQHRSAEGRIACARCHGTDGDGVGPMSSMFDPPPRNFTCSKTINGVPDGQLFWIIQNGSPGTSMPSFNNLKDEQIWQIVLYIRQLANSHYDG